MKEHYVSYEQAVKLKELGYKGKSNAYYWTEDKAFEETNSIVHKNSDTCQTVVIAPFLWQAQAWLRDVKGIDIEPRIWLVGGKREYRPYVMPPKCKDYIAYPPEDTYELALSAGLDCCIEILTDKTDDE